MNKTIQFVATTPEELQEKIAVCVKTQLKDFLEIYKPKQPNDYLTRQQVAELLHLDISSVHNWSKKGYLKPLSIGGRIYFLRSDVENSLHYLKP
jgi:hypothetical protein